MNQRLTTTGYRLLRASRRLSHLPQLAPAPRAFATLLTDPAELLEKTCNAALSAPRAEPSVFAEPTQSTELDSLDIPRRASVRRANPTTKQFKNPFATTTNQRADFSEIADAGKWALPSSLPPNLFDAAFWSATARPRFGNPSPKQNIRDNKNTSTGAAAGLQSFTKNLMDEPTAKAASEPSKSKNEPTAEAVSEPPHSKNELTAKAVSEPPHSEDGLRLTRGSSRLAALLNANLRAQTEPQQPADFDPTPDSPPRGRQSLNLVRGAISSRPVAETKAAERSFSELPPALGARTDQRSGQFITDDEKVLPAPESEPAASAASPPTVEAVLEELYERLRVEFLRTYGSSGG